MLCGEAKGRGAALLTILAARHIHVDDDTRGRIASCTEVALLDRWIGRAANAASVNEIFE